MAVEIEKASTEITTIDQLDQSLANHTRLISDEIIMPALKQSIEYKPIIEFFHSVQKHLIQSPDELDQKGPGLSGKFQRGWHPRPNKNSKFQITNKKSLWRASHCPLLYAPCSMRFTFASLRAYYRIVNAFVAKKIKKQKI